VKRFFVLTLLIAATFVATPSLQAICEHCFQWDTGRRYGTFSEIKEYDASCCIVGNSWCDQMEFNDYSQQKWFISDCNAVWFDWGTEVGYRCDGNTACSAGGPGGGPGGSGGGSGTCHIQFGQLCPASCMSCTYYY
jgi:hypothetical protein